MPTLIYDGACSFCRGAVDWVRDRDPHGAIALLPYQDPELERRFPQVRRADCERELHLVLDDGRVLRGADALPALLERLPPARALARPLRFAPVAAIARWLYRRFAALRPRDPLAMNGDASDCTRCAHGSSRKANE